MQLTDVKYLSANDSQSASIDIGAIVQSFSLSSPLGALRYTNIPSDEFRQWITKGIKADLDHEFSYPRIRDFDSDGLGFNVVRYEGLVIRDLDLQKLSTEDTRQLVSGQGRVIAHASFLYHPAHEKKDTKPATKQETDFLSAPDPDDELPLPGHRELHNYWNNAVETALKAEFGGLHCFEVRELSVLAPTHWRKGIASKLLQWIFPYAERLGIPVVLAATPAGYPLYLKHGFVDVSGKNGIVECDMAQWGGAGVHRHVLMTRASTKEAAKGSDTTGTDASAA